MADVNEIVYENWDRTARSNVTIGRVVRGVAAMLNVSEGELMRHVAKVLPACLVGSCPRQDEVLALQDALERIYGALLDPDAWNAYADRPGPSAMRYAAAVAAYLYLLAEYYGSLIPLDCPLYHPRVASLILVFLTTRQAPSGSTVRDAIMDAAIEIERRSGRRVADPLEPCRPPRR
jgi:hypothetical protein